MDVLITLLTFYFDSHTLSLIMNIKIDVNHGTLKRILEQ